VRKDPAENVKPDKEKSTERIDGVVAMLMGLDRALRSQLQPSIYEPDGPRGGKLLSLWDDEET
jgi:phage terminase large subunit-like protein